jgi:hypothetical protein
MKNIDRQKSLDKKKWVISKRNEMDMSGKMYYCKKCTHKTDDTEYVCTFKCTATQEERESQRLCATAYNRLAREN